MSKAEEKTWEWASKNKLDPYSMGQAYAEGYCQAKKDLTDKAKTSSGWDGFFYGQGYKQAKKDLELTWEDAKEIYCIALNLRDHVGSSVFGQPFYEEVLKQFKDYKERKEKIDN